MDEAVVEAGEEEEGAGDAANPGFDVGEDVEGLAELVGGKGDEHGKEDDGHCGADAIEEGQDEEGLIGNGKRDQDAEEESGGDRAEGEGKEAAEGNGPEDTAFFGAMLDFIADEMHGGG